LQEKRKKYQMKNKNLKKPVSTLRPSKDKKFMGHTGY